MGATFTTEMRLEKLDNTSNPDEAWNDSMDIIDLGGTYKLVAAEAIDAGEWVRQDASNEGVLAQADSAANSMVLGIAVADTANADDVYLRYAGVIEISGWGLTVSSQYYLDPDTPGAMTTVRPTGSDITVELGETDDTGEKFYIRIRIYNTVVTGGQHSTLAELDWDVAGHVMNTTLDMAINDIDNIQDLIFDGAANVTSPTGLSFVIGVTTMLSIDGTEIDAQGKNIANLASMDNGGSGISIASGDALIIKYNASANKILFERSDGGDTGQLYMDGDAVATNMIMNAASSVGTIALQINSSPQWKMDLSGNQDWYNNQVSNAGNIRFIDGASIGQSAGPLLTFDDTNNFLEITQCLVGIGIAVPTEKLHVQLNQVGVTRFKVQNDTLNAASGAGFQIKAHMGGGAGQGFTAGAYATGFTGFAGMSASSLSERVSFRTDSQVDGFDINVTGAGNIKFGTANTLRLEITATGNFDFNGGTLSNVAVIDNAGSNITIANGDGLNVYEDITWLGATTENLIKFPDHLAIALRFAEAGNAYLDFVSTNGAEAIVIYKDLDFSGDGSGLSFGSLYLHEGAQNIDISAVGQGVYVKITGFTTGELNNVTINSDAFNVGCIGRYKIDWQISGDSAGNNKDYEVDIFVNNVEQPDGSSRKEFGALGSLGSISGTAIIDITNTGHDIDLRIKEVGGGAGTDFDIFNMSFNVVLVGGT